jgi:hypothetical protein
MGCEYKPTMGCDARERDKKINYYWNSSPDQGRQIFPSRAVLLIVKELSNYTHICGGGLLPYSLH